MKRRRRAGGGRPGPALERFMAKVEKTDACWNWTGAVSSSGYGSFGPGGKGKTVLAHRWSFEHHKQPLGTLFVDHLCQNKLCVNPEHLEAVSNEVNAGRFHNLRYREAAKAGRTSVTPPR